MLIVVADTGPINYLVLIGQPEILPALFEKVMIPAAVHDELANAAAPPAVHEWIQLRPAWLEVHVDAGSLFDDAPKNLDKRERAALALVPRLAPISYLWMIAKA